MKKNSRIISFVLSMIFMFSFIVPKQVFAEESKDVFVRVEGLNNTIVEGKAKGVKALDAIEAALKTNNINYNTKKESWGSMITEIEGLKSGKFGGYDGWMYYVKDNGKVVSPQVGIDAFDLKNGMEVIVYYSDNTPYVNSVTFEPKVVKENESFKIKFAYSSLDWNTKKEIIQPIKEVKVSIDGSEFTTDKDGYIEVENGLSKGDHSYKISGYEKDKVSKVIMDKGGFTIDNVNTPSIVFSDFSYKESSNVSATKDVKGTLNDTVNFMKTTNSSPWAAYSLRTLGIEPKGDFIEKLKKEIDTNGVEDMTPGNLISNIIGVSAFGYTPYDFNGKNLVKELYDRKIDTLLANEAVFALLTYSALNLDEDYAIKKADLVNRIVESQLNYTANNKKCMGWTWYGDKVDPDLTAAAINALVPYYADAKVKEKVDGALNTLKSALTDDGNIIGQYGPASETNAFVIMALTSLGINPESYKGTKGDLVSAFLAYKGDNGQFNHDNGTKNNLFSTEQALRALITLNSFNSNGKSNYYTSNIVAKNLPKYSDQKPMNEIKEEKGKLPQTGSSVGFEGILAIGAMISLAGVIIFSRKREA